MIEWTIGPAAPYSMSCGTTRLTKSTGMANPTPAEAPVFVKMAVLTPSKQGRLATHVLARLTDRHVV